MTKEQNKNFIVKTESLVNPKDVTAISFLGDFNKLLPKKAQHKIMVKGSSKIPYMGFIVDPYGFFLAYRIKDRAAAEAMLPQGYELADTSFFAGDEKVPMVIFSAFYARTSAFTGMRLECYIIARNIKSGLMSWIIADYETNTNSHDPKNQFCGYSCDKSVFTTTPYGELLVDVKASDSEKEFAVKADIKQGIMEDLDEDLWVQGNMSVDYGGELKSENSSPFSLIFDPVLMKEANRLPLEYVEIQVNSFMENLIDCQHPECAAFFPYSQHFIIRQDIQAQEISKKDDLIQQIGTFIQKNGFKTMSGDDIKKPLFRGMILSSVLNLGIILFLLLKLRG